MDFLDPQAKRRHLIRLIIGYGLMAVLIGIASFILLFQAYGFDLDRETGEVIQKGLVYVDSAPDGANILFNGQSQNDKTNNRFALPAGQYDLQIRKDGYREWRRDFALNGGEVERFTYPMLLPESLNRREIQAYEAPPSLVTTSPDRRWIIVGQAGSLTNFIEYDLNSLTALQPKSRGFSVPEGLFTAAAGDHAFELVEWSNDNKHFLVKHSTATGFEFVVVSRDQPETSININRLLGQNPTTVSLRDKKFDQWYLYTAGNGTVQAADAKKAVSLLLSSVTSFKTHGDDTILYSQTANDNKNQRVTLQQGRDAYVLKDIVNGAVYLDIARYEDNWYVVVGADAEQKTYIYKNPLEVLQKRDGTKPPNLTILKTAGAMTQVGFSQNTRFILTQSGQHFETYDIEYDQLYKFDIAQPLDPGNKVIWMDGHRLLARSGAKAFSIDFDGSNRQDLVNSQVSAPIIFDRDYTVLYNVDASTGKNGLFASDLRLEGDK